MIASLRRPLPFDARPPAPAAAPPARAGREPPRATSRRGASEAEPPTPGRTALAAGSAAAPSSAAPAGGSGLASAPYLAQLLGQQASPRDAVSAGRGQTSFRVSHVERYEEVVRWTRRIELLFAFEGLAAPIPA